MTAGVEELVRRMDRLLRSLEAAGDPARFFLGTYLRTTRAVAGALDDRLFEDPAWMAEWMGLVSPPAQRHKISFFKSWRARPLR